jgi:serine/threonine protein kinase
MAPEIYAAREDRAQFYDARPTDVFAFGVLLFAMVVGRFPFEQATKSDRLYILII